LNLIFDLDGTLIDSSRRMFSLFNNLVAESTLDKDSYWILKRNGISHETILREKFNYSTNRIADFSIRWMDLIESTSYLAFDLKYANVDEKLATLKKSGSLYLCTSRQSISSTLSQLKKLGLYELFDEIIITQHRSTKHDLIIKYIDVTPNDWMIGDTGYDIKTGHQLGISTCAVTNGFLCEEVLRRYNPRKIIENISMLDVGC
jgi:phosphoglycolate phosphatase